METRASNTSQADEREYHAHATDGLVGIYPAVTRGMRSLVVTQGGAIAEYLETASRAPRLCNAESCV